jgi:hypothetical protein
MTEQTYGEFLRERIVKQRERSRSGRGARRAADRCGDCGKPSPSAYYCESCRTRRKSRR